MLTLLSQTLQRKLSRDLYLLQWNISFAGCFRGWERLVPPVIKTDFPDRELRSKSEVALTGKPAVYSTTLGLEGRCILLIVLNSH